MSTRSIPGKQNGDVGDYVRSMLRVANAHRKKVPERINAVRPAMVRRGSRLSSLITNPLKRLTRPSAHETWIMICCAFLI